MLKTCYKFLNKNSIAFKTIEFLYIYFKFAKIWLKNIFLTIFKIFFDKIIVKNYFILSSWILFAARQASAAAMIDCLNLLLFVVISQAA